MKNRATIILIATMFLMLVVMPITIIPVHAENGWSFYDVDTESSDVDGSANIGIAAGDFNDTQHFNEGAWENITESYVDIERPAWYGRQAKLSGGGFRADFPQRFTSDADRKLATWFNVPNDFEVDYLSFYGRADNDVSINVRMAIYNDSGAAQDRDAHPTTREWFAVTEDIVVNQTAGYWNASFTRPPMLIGGRRYWLTVHWDAGIWIWKSRLMMMYYNKSAKALDSFATTSLSFDGGGPHEWNKYGGFFDIAAYGNETVQNYQLDWEYQFQGVNPNWQYYQILIYAYTNTSEEIQIQVWDPPPDSEWDYWGEGYPYWKINQTEKWCVSALFQHIDSTITIRLKASDESANDQTKSAVFIDAIFIYGYNISIDITNPIELTMSEPYNPGDSFVEFDNSPMTVHIETGQDWNIHYRGGTGNPNWVWISNSSDSADAVPLIVWGTSDPLFTENQARGDGSHDINVWVFLNIPIPDPPDLYDGHYATYLRLTISGDLINEPINPP